MLSPLSTSSGKRLTPVARFILIGACVVVLIGGIKLAAPILSPLIFAMFIAIILLPLLDWLKSKGFPTLLAMLVIILGLVVVGSLLVLFVYVSLSQLDDKLPYYQTRLTSLKADLESFLKSWGIELGQLTSNNQLSPSSIGGYVLSLINNLFSILSDSFLILLLCIFTIIEARFFSAKLKKGLGADHILVNQLAIFSLKVQKFMYLKTINNLIVAVGAVIFLLVLGIDFALLWGILIFFLSYIPNVGIVLASIPAVALALLEQGIGMTIVVALGVTIINLVGDNVLTPKLMGDGLDLSQFAVFFSFLFWLWVLGPTGGLLSIPLTVLVKLLLEINPTTHWLALLLAGNKPGASPPARSEPEKV